MNKKFIFPIILLTIFALSFVGCGSQREQQESVTNGNVIKNYTFSGTDHMLHVQNRPQKLIVCGSNACDTIIALGIKDEIKILTVENFERVKHYEKLLPSAKIYPTAINQESALTLKPDMILAQRRFFDDKVLGDTVFWEQNGTLAYIQEASGPIPSLGNFPHCTIESEKTFVTNMGIIFQQQQKAKQYTDIIDSTLKNAQIQLKGKAKQKVMVVEFLNETIEIFGRNLLSGDIVQQLGGEIVDYGHPFISLENLLENNADVIFVVYHGGKKEETAALAHFDKGIYSHFKAVQNNRIYPLPYNFIVAPGIHTAESIEYIAKGMTGK